MGRLRLLQVESSVIPAGGMVLGPEKGQQAVGQCPNHDVITKIISLNRCHKDLYLEAVMAQLGEKQTFLLL